MKWGKKGGEGAYGLRLADDGGDGAGGVGEDGGGVHPLQVHVRRHVQARHLPPPLLLLLADLQEKFSSLFLRRRVWKLVWKCCNGGLT